MSSANYIRSNKQKAVIWALTIFIGFCALLLLYPVIYISLGSFKENKELLLGERICCPNALSWRTTQAWQNANFSVYTKNSFSQYRNDDSYCHHQQHVRLCVLAKDFKYKELLYSTFVAFMFINVGSVTEAIFELAVKLKMNTSLVSVVPFWSVQAR